MPAHQQLDAVRNRALSNKRFMTTVDWRANRLVDALAKKAARTTHAPRAVTCLLESANVAVRHAAALLGVVTHAANNQKVPVQRPDGSWGFTVQRDSAAVGELRKRKVRVGQEPSPPVVELRAGTQTDDPLLPLCDGAEPCKRRRTAEAALLLRRRREDQEHVNRRVAELAANATGADSGPTAQQRLEEVRRRVRARLAARTGG